MKDTSFLNLNSYKLDYNNLALQYRKTFLKLNIDISKFNLYFISIKSDQIKLNLSKLTNNSIVIFSNCNDLDIVEISDFLKIKNKSLIFYFYNSSNITYVKDITSSNLIFKNKLVIEKSKVNFTNLFFDSEKLSYFQENYILNKSLLSQNDILLLSKNQKNLINVKNIHMSKKVISNTTIKNVLKDNSFVRYDGLINILKQADLSKAYLETNTMMLSKNARSINIPMLEIVPKNIIATHSATVEQVTLDELFYLGSRGLSKKDANNLIVSSFLKAGVSSYSELIKIYISSKIEGKL